MAAVILFAMAAGAASYHQYKETRQADPEEIYYEYFILKEETVQEPETIILPYPSCVDSKEQIREESYYDSLELLAICVEAEAGNQSILGKRMVVDVILNRVDSKDWPDTIEEVITQKYAFSSYWDGGMDRAIPSEETYEAVRQELEKRTYTDIYYFTAGGYGAYGIPFIQVEDHYFSK